MSTSGTVGQTVITVQNLIDSGARRAGKLAEELTSEQILASKQSLYYLLSNLVNRGIQYWCIEKSVIGLQPDKYIYYHQNMKRYYHEDKSCSNTILEFHLKN